MAWVKALHPAHGIAQTGWNNHYGFPHPKVIERYRAVGARVWNTAEGAVHVYVLENRLQVRQTHPRSSTNRVNALQWGRALL